MEKFNEENFISICNKLAKKDKELKAIIKQHGHPPMWTRPATFQSLILFILEQQVSLASAYAAFKKLKVKPKEVIIIEDAPHGVKAAKSSGANVIEVAGYEQVNLTIFNKYL